MASIKQCFVLKTMTVMRNFTGEYLWTNFVGLLLWYCWTQIPEELWRRNAPVILNLTMISLRLKNHESAITEKIGVSLGINCVWTWLGGWAVAWEWNGDARHHLWRSDVENNLPLKTPVLGSIWQLGDSANCWFLSYTTYLQGAKVFSRSVEVEQ